MERDLLLAEGLNAAFLGIGLREGQPDVAVYSIQRALAVYITHGMTESEAREHLDRVHVSNDVGELTPVWVDETTVDQLVTPQTVH